MPADTESEGILAGMRRVMVIGAAGEEKMTAGRCPFACFCCFLYFCILISDFNKLRGSVGIRFRLDEASYNRFSSVLRLHLKKNEEFHCITFFTWLLLLVL